MGNVSSVTELMRSVIQVLTPWALNVLGALLVLWVGSRVARWARGVVQRARTKVDDTLVPFMSSCGYYAVLAFVVIAALGMVGIQTASIIAVFAAAGLAVGLALQGTLANFAAGVMLLIFRPFRRGDFIEAAGTAGTVEAISIFTTTLSSVDNVAIVVPNAAVWGQTIRNYATNPTRRIDLVVGIAYSDKIQTAMEAIQEVLATDTRVLHDPAPTIAVGELGDSAVHLFVRPWCKAEVYWDVRWHLTRAIKEGLERAGCTIPFPQRDVHVFPASVTEQGQGAHRQAAV
jgi:small conductance mechanosensitive channel